MFDTGNSKKVDFINISGPSMWTCAKIAFFGEKCLPESSDPIQMYDRVQLIFAEE